MTTVAELENTVRSWVESVSGRDCYLQNQMGPAPADPYCTVWIQPIEHFNHDVKTYDFVTDPANPTQDMRGLALVTFVISVWNGDDAISVANRIRVSTGADARIYDIYNEAGKGDVSIIQDLTTEHNGVLERRAEFSLSIYATLSETFGVECFDKTDFTTPDGDTATIGTNNPPPSQDTSGCP